MCQGVFPPAFNPCDCPRSELSSPRHRRQPPHPADLHTDARHASSRRRSVASKLYDFILHRHDHPRGDADDRNPPPGRRRFHGDLDPSKPQGDDDRAAADIDADALAVFDGDGDDGDDGDGGQMKRRPHDPNYYCMALSYARSRGIQEMVKSILMIHAFGFDDDDDAAARSSRSAADYNADSGADNPHIVHAFFFDST